MTHLFPRVGVFVIALASVTSPAGGAPRTVLTYEEFLQKIDTDHPLAKRDTQTVREIEESVQRAGLLSDPLLQFGRENENVPFTMQKMGEESALKPSWVVGVTQEFPWPGTLEAQKQAARAKVSVAKVQTDLARDDRRLTAAEFYVQTVSAQKLLVLQKDSLVEAEKLLAITQARRKQGFGSHAELLQSQTEIEILRSTLSALEADLKARELQAAQMIGSSQAVGFSTDWPAALVKADAKGVPASGEKSDRQKEIIQASLDQKIAQLSASRAQSKPSLMGSLQVMKEDKGSTMFNAMVGVRVPLFSEKNRSSIDESVKIGQNISARDSEWYASRRQLAEQLSQQRQVLASENARALDEKILPLVNEHFKVLLADFAQGRASLPEINQVRRNLLRLRMAQVRARESLALERIQQHRVAVGLAEGTVDRPMPVLSLEGMEQGGGMSAPSSGMSSGNRMNNKSRSSGNSGAGSLFMPTQPAPALPGASSEEDSQAPTAGGGMGGM